MCTLTNTKHYHEKQILKLNSLKKVSSFNLYFFCSLMRLFCLLTFVFPLWLIAYS